MTSAAASAFATHTFRPVIRYPALVRTALVFWFAASVPASGSDKANAPIASPAARRRSHCSLCGARPACAISSATRQLVTESDTATVALARAIASMASAQLT